MGDRPGDQPVERGPPPSGHFEQALDFDRCIGGSAATPTVDARVPALVAERRDHQVGGAVHHLGAVDETRRRIDEAAEPHHAHDLVEIAERGLDLREQLMAQARAAFWPSSIDTPAPSWPLATSLPSPSKQIWPETISRLPVRTNGT